MRMCIIPKRQHVGYSFALTREQGLKYMDSIKEDILQARKGNIVFQIETENCGKWIQTKLEEHLGKENVPNLYRTALIDSEPLGWLGWGWRIIRLMPQFCQSKILAWCHYPLGHGRADGSLIKMERRFGNLCRRVRIGKMGSYTCLPICISSMNRACCRKSPDIKPSILAVMLRSNNEVSRWRKIHSRAWMCLKNQPRKA